ncbi:hypothetical protein [Heliorestis convoluta]|uniref:Uncharacterized protein n=1 Tax=Heliorestis convoluta TaxID=356322 RepID=A0A5Q2MZH0_9FIRM|nr:hypothetical protein [Heliorestis convoluta]QGG46859.1 hypothetical protein FTV88_0681 [Heliorestis convoluta]
MLRYIKLNGELSEKKIGIFDILEEEKPFLSETVEIHQLEELRNQFKKELEQEIYHFELNKQR